MSHRAAPVSPLRRLAAAACAGLVLLLTLLAASPDAHALLHADDAGAIARGDAATALPVADADDCAVVLFASTVDLAVAPLALTPPRLLCAGESLTPVAELFLVVPRYLRQPERGPPAEPVA